MPDDLRSLEAALDNNIRKFRRFITNSTKLCEMAKKFPQHAHRLMAVILQHPGEFQRIVKTYDDLYLIGITFPSYQLLNPSVLDNIELFQSLIPNNYKLWLAAKAFPGYADTIIRIVLTHPGEFQRLITNNNELCQIMAAFPKFAHALLDAALANNANYRFTKTDGEVYQIVKLLPHHPSVRTYLKKVNTGNVKTALETFAAKGFKLTQDDERIFHEYQAQFISDKQDSVLYANIALLLAKKEIVDHLLKGLDHDVKALWDEEAQTDTSVLKLHRPTEYIELFGLTWPIPKPNLAQNKSRHLLSRALLQMEQRHGINHSSRHPAAPVPTLVGFLTSEEAKDILAKDELWNEESKMGVLFYHGKMTHRIQFYLIMRAIEEGLLDIGMLSVPELIKKLNTDTSGMGQLPWDQLVDFNASNLNVMSNVLVKFSLQKPLLTRCHPSIRRGNYRSPHVYGCDPYFLHSYIMTESRLETPYLSECVTQTFCKSLFGIQKIEDGIRYLLTTSQPYFRRELGNTIELRKREKTDATVVSTMQRIAKAHSIGDLHVIQPHHIVIDQRQRRKISKIHGSVPKIHRVPVKEQFPESHVKLSIHNIRLTHIDTSDGFVQYRQMHGFFSPPSQGTKRREAPVGDVRVGKRARGSK